MSSGALLLPREVGVVAVGIGALVIGLVAGHATPTFSHMAKVEKAELEVAKNVHELLPDSFRIEATVKKTGLTLLQSEDILLLGGDRSDTSCSGGALFLYWEDGAFGFGCQCNGPSSAGCPGTAPGCSDPAVTGASKFKPNVQYSVVAEYDRKTETASMHVDGELYFSKHARWTPPRSGPVTLLAGSHSSVDMEPFFGEAQAIGVYPLPAGSWGWDMIGVVAGFLGVYVGLGSAIGRRTYQRTGSILEAHPHSPMWSAMSGMVTDGIDWTLRRASAAPRRADYSALDTTGGPVKERKSTSADSLQQRKRADQNRVGQVDRKEVGVGSVSTHTSTGEGCTDSTSVQPGNGPVASAEAPRAQTAGGQAILSTGARETGAKIVY